jgi:hypothetical protein
LAGHGWVPAKDGRKLLLDGREPLQGHSVSEPVAVVSLSTRLDREGQRCNGIEILQSLLAQGVAFGVQDFVKIDKHCADGGNVVTMSPTIGFVNYHIDIAPGGIPQGKVVKAFRECPALVLRGSAVAGQRAELKDYVRRAAEVFEKPLRIGAISGRPLTGFARWVRHRLLAAVFVRHSGLLKKWFKRAGRGTAALRRPPSIVSLRCLAFSVVVPVAFGNNEAVPTACGIDTLEKGIHFGRCRELIGKGLAVFLDEILGFAPLDFSFDHFHLLWSEKVGEPVIDNVAGSLAFGRGGELPIID